MESYLCTESNAVLNIGVALRRLERPADLKMTRIISKSLKTDAVIVSKGTTSIDLNRTLYVVCLEVFVTE